MGRTWARALVATAVASKVGSSMWWHMPTTNSSPMGSTSMSAPQCGSQNSPLWSSSSLNWKSRKPCGAPTSNCMPLKMVATSSPWKPSALCMRCVYTGLAPIHSAIAISRIAWAP